MFKKLDAVVLQPRHKVQRNLTAFHLPPEKEKKCVYQPWISTEPHTAENFITASFEKLHIVSISERTLHVQTYRNGEAAEVLELHREQVTTAAIQRMHEEPTTFVCDTKNHLFLVLESEWEQFQTTISPQMCFQVLTTDIMQPGTEFSYYCGSVLKTFLVIGHVFDTTIVWMNRAFRALHTVLSDMPINPNGIFTLNRNPVKKLSSKQLTLMMHHTLSLTQFSLLRNSSRATQAVMPAASAMKQIQHWIALKILARSAATNRYLPAKRHNGGAIRLEFPCMAENSDAPVATFRVDIIASEAGFAGKPQLVQNTSDNSVPGQLMKILYNNYDKLFSTPSMSPGEKAQNLQALLPQLRKNMPLPSLTGLTLAELMKQLNILTAGLNFQVKFLDTYVLPDLMP